MAAWTIGVAFWWAGLAAADDPAPPAAPPAAEIAALIRKLDADLP